MKMKFIFSLLLLISITACSKEIVEYNNFKFGTSSETVYNNCNTIFDVTKDILSQKGINSLSFKIPYKLWINNPICYSNINNEDKEILMLFTDDKLSCLSFNVNNDSSINNFINIHNQLIKKYSITHEYEDDDLLMFETTENYMLFTSYNDNQVILTATPNNIISIFYCSKEYGNFIVENIMNNYNDL